MLRFGFALFIGLSNILVTIKCENNPSIIIVGAGAAGIAAASKLLENNFNNITILEAENRTGGRIFTTKFGKEVVDLGAEWCHGINGNIVYDLAKNLDLLNKEVDAAVYFKETVYYSTREGLDLEFVGETFDIFWGLYENYDREKEMSYGEYLPYKYKEVIKEKYENDTAKLNLSSELLNMYISATLSYEGAFSLSDTSAKSDFEECEGGNLYWKKGGYQNILDILIHKYPNPSKELPVLHNTFLNKDVTRISWDDGQDLVIVNCSDGSSYSADHVILTPSLGVLKHRYKTLFEPPLPQQKINVIEDLGIAAVLKVALYYSEDWWSKENLTGFTFAWSDEDSKNVIKEYPHGPSQNGRSWLLDVQGIYLVREKSNILTAWFTGPTVPEIEKLTDEEIVSGIVFLLSKFVGHRVEVIPTPDAVLRNNWYMNDHFRGTYSFQTVKSRQHGSSPELLLSESLKSKNGKLKVLFAGEATNPIHYSTVHGAIETGRREAERILSFYR